MAGNFLEQLVSEWYEYQGYFVRRNVPVGKRAKGGWEGELDVVAFNPVESHLIHIEPSMDAQSWAQREERYKRKFDLGREHIPELFAGMPLPKEIEQVALLGFASKQNHQSLGGGQIVLVSELLEAIFERLRETHISRNAVPEHLPILRGFQFAASHRKEVCRALGGETN
ncbi:MAG: hypothetical protein WCA08_16235 [Desulfoferrobacter sp.]